MNAVAHFQRWLERAPDEKVVEVFRHLYVVAPFGDFRGLVIARIITAHLRDLAEQELFMRSAERMAKGA